MKREINKCLGIRGTLKCLPMLIFSFMFASFSAYADDIDVFFESAVSPNIMFMIDNSGSMCWHVNNGNNENCVGINNPNRRINQLQASFNDLIFNSGLLDGKYVGISAFHPDNTEGGRIYSPVLYIDGSTQGTTNRNTLWNIVNSLDGASPIYNGSRDSLLTNTATPLGETLYEIGRYFKGQSPYFGVNNFQSNSTRASDPSSLMQASDDLSIYDDKQVGNYKSPIIDPCQKSFVVMMTDGAAQYDLNHTNPIETATGDTCDNPPSFGSTIDPNDNRSCLRAVARHLHSTDLDNLDNTGNDNFDNVIDLHTIAFALNDTSAVNLMRNAASDGGGTFNRASNTQGLNDAFSEIFNEVNDNTFSGVAPRIPVSSNSRFSSGNFAFYSVFQPSNSIRWQGNLKPYKLKPETITRNGKQATVIKMYGKHDKAALNGNQFADDVTSFWSNNSSKDGGTVTVGGVRDRFVDRKLFISPSRYTAQPSTSAQITYGPSTYNVNNMGEVSGADLSYPGVNITTDWQRRKVLAWALGSGYQGSLTSRWNYEFTDFAVFGDALHSEPQVVSYANGQQRVYFGTNMGMLHAIGFTYNSAGDNFVGDSGKEVYTWMPRSLLPNLTKYYVNSGFDASNGEKVYGLDGNMTFYHDDQNRNNKVESTETALLIIGMRRGGNSWYILDVSDPDEPSLIRELTSASGYEVGQTWSKPVIRRIKWGGQSKKVIFLAGGYDPARDTKPASDSIEDTTGRALYMLDAENGNLLWSAGNSSGSYNYKSSDMTSSFVAAPALSDIDGDGYIDVMVAVDLAGRVWRFDFNKAATSGADFLKWGSDNRAGATMIANLNTGESRRFFFNEPALNITELDGDRNFKTLNVALTTGRIPDPTETDSIQDEFYLLRQLSLTVPPSLYDVDPTTAGKQNYQTLTKADLVRVTIGSQLGGTVGTATVVNDTGNNVGSIRDTRGFYMTFNRATGEKSLSPVLLNNHMAIFSTYSPKQSGTSNGACDGQSDLGASFLYVVGISEPRFYQVYEMSQPGPAAAPSIVTYNNVDYIMPPVNVSVGNFAADGVSIALCKKEPCGPGSPPPPINSEPFTKFWIEKSLDEE